jgi:hypothetical protein
LQDEGRLQRDGMPRGDRGLQGDSRRRSRPG